MTYATKQDLIDRAGEAEIFQVADREGPTSEDQVISAALEDADRKIDAYLAVRYSVPLSSVPTIVLGWAVSIARYTLHRDGAPDHVVRDYRDALAELKDASAGRLAVPDAAGVSPQVSSQGGTISEGSEPMFTRDRLEGWL